MQDTIYKMIETEQNRRADRSVGRRDLSLPEQLEKLDELRQRGVRNRGPAGCEVVVVDGHHQAVAWVTGHCGPGYVVLYGGALPLPGQSLG